MAKISETELQKRLRKLEADSTTTKDFVTRVGDQLEYSQNHVYVAYASALSGLSGGAISSQSDATDFQFSPYNDAGVLLAFVGFFTNKSIYQSGDPTDYTWESTSGASGYTSSERYYTLSTKLLTELGNPTEPGTGVTWTVVTAGTAIPSSAIWIAERYTISGITSDWALAAVGAYVSASTINIDGNVAITADNAGFSFGDITAYPDVTNTARPDSDESGGFFGELSGIGRFFVGNEDQYVDWDGNKLVIGGDIISSGNITSLDESQVNFSKYALDGSNSGPDNSARVDARIPAGGSSSSITLTTDTDTTQKTGHTRLSISSGAKNRTLKPFVDNGGTPLDSSDYKVWYAFRGNNQLKYNQTDSDADPNDSDLFYDQTDDDADPNDSDLFYRLTVNEGDWNLINPSTSFTTSDPTLVDFRVRTYNTTAADGLKFTASAGGITEIIRMAVGASGTTIAPTSTFEKYENIILTALYESGSLLTSASLSSTNNKVYGFIGSTATAGTVMVKIEGY